MKYIKRYKIFESKEFFEGIEVDIKDILLEVEDIGYYSFYTYYEYHKLVAISIYKFPHEKPIELEEVKDCVNRIFEYVKSENTSWLNLSIEDRYSNDIINAVINVKNIENIEPSIWEENDIYTIYIKAYF